MEENVVGGKEKKYVLYTVVGGGLGQAGLRVWVVRVLLGALVLVALAVVPYLSVRLAQASSIPDAATQDIMPSSQKTTTDQNANLTTKTPVEKLLVMSTTLAPSPSTTTSTTTTTTTTTSHHPPLTHKLVYVATAASGNHVGGFCVWKTDQHVTNWAFFYDNIPNEYQSHQDTADHEMRGMLAAVRTWSSLWEDHHVVLRSHHPSIKGADHPTRRQLSHELEHLSEGHFSYELEWRLRKTDHVVDIAFCLAHLYRDFAHWYRTFQGHVDELLGPQDWRKVGKEKRTEVPKSAFHTEDTDDEDFDDNIVKK